MIKEHDGGEMPVPGDARVRVRFNNGEWSVGDREDDTSLAVDWDWTEEGEYGIAAYEVIE